MYLRPLPITAINAWGSIEQAVKSMKLTGSTWDKRLDMRKNPGGNSQGILSTMEMK